MFPNRHFGFNGVDNKAAGGKGGIAVRRAHAHEHGDFADGELAHAVHANRLFNGEALLGLGDDGFALALRELGVGGVNEVIHGFAVVVAAHPAFKAVERAATLVLRELFAQGLDVDGLVGEGKHG